MTLNNFESDLLDSSVARVILSLLKQNHFEYTIEDVREKLIQAGLTLTEEMTEKLPGLMEKWSAYFRKKQEEYQVKSKYVTWLTDQTYQLLP